MKNLSLLFFSLMLIGCSPYQDASHEPIYAPVIGKVYKAKTTLVVYKSERHDAIAQIEKPGQDLIPEVKDLPKKFPAEVNGEYLLGVLKEGSVIKILKAVRFRSTTMGGVYFHAAILDNGDLQNVVINTWPLGIGPDHQYDAKLVEEVSTSSNQ